MATTIHARDWELLAHPERVASIKEGIEQSRRGEATAFPPGHFTRLAAELGADD